MTSITLRRNGTWELLEKDGTTELTESGIDGLVGELTDVATVTPGIPGQVVTSQDVKPATGTIKAYISGDATRDAGEVWAALRADLTQSATRNPPMELQLTTRWGIYFANLRLNGALAAPVVNPDHEDLLEFAAPVILDDGYYRSAPRRATGVVTISNPGDVTIYPKIHWTGNGGRVTLPSSWDFTLPAVTERRTLYLDPLESMAVTTPTGAVDYATMDALELVALPEGVPPGEERKFQLPAGAEAEWAIGWLDPWAKR